MAIAQAVLEYLDEMQPRTLFATHYHELTALATNGGLNHVSCLTIDVREHNNEIIFMHKIVAGVANRSYGIHVARMAGMPKSVIARAECVLSALESNEPEMPSQNCAPKPASAPTPKKSCVSDNVSPQLSLFS
jgi:DNA mismatch repair protein MutS